VASPGRADFYLTLADLELDRVRAGQLDELRLRRADRAAELGLARAPNAAWIALRAGQYWAARAALAPTPEAWSEMRRLLARAVLLDPSQSYEAMRTAVAATGKLADAEAIASQDPAAFANQPSPRLRRSAEATAKAEAGEAGRVQEELRKLRVNLDPDATRRTFLALP